MHTIYLDLYYFTTISKISEVVWGSDVHDQYGDLRINGGSKSTVMSGVDHPRFAEIREELETAGYIETSRYSSNGDVVLKQFCLNYVTFLPRERFPCAGAQHYSQLRAMEAV